MSVHVKQRNMRLSGRTSESRSYLASHHTRLLRNLLTFNPVTQMMIFYVARTAQAGFTFT
jgi:hypothetical protein